MIAAPTAFLTDKSTGEEFFDYLPGATAAYASWYALHEWLGLLAQVVLRWLEEQWPTQGLSLGALNPELMGKY